MHSRGFVHTFEIDAEHRLHIYVGSITEVTADALVSSDDNYLSAGGGVSAAIASAAGVGIRDIYQRVVSTLKSTVGDVVRTVAGALNARHLYHAITIDFDTQEMMDEAGLRRLVGNIVESAKEDRINSLAMPALGTGAAFFQLERAAPVIISELLRRLTETRISDVTLALVDSDATRVFYEELLRAQTDAVAVRALRHREEGLVFCEKRGGEGLNRLGARMMRPAYDVYTPSSNRLPAPASRLVRLCVDAGRAPAQVVRALKPAASTGSGVRSAESGVVEQFPNLVDEVRLAAAPPNRPKLVEGLAALILNHAPESEVETELLTHPACRGFRGTVRQRLIEFLYISETHHRKALGAALFRNRDLRCMLGELEEAHSHLSTDEELATAILRCLCFNTLAPPTGMRQHIQNVEAQMEASRDIRNTTDLDSVGNQTGQILERFLHELIALYSCLFWGPGFEEELITRKMLDKNSARSLSTTTVGKAWEVITGITKALNKEQSMQEVWSGLGRTERLLLPRTVKFPGSVDMLNTEEVLRDVEAWRRASVHDRPDTSAPGAGPAQRDAVVLTRVSVPGRTGASSPDLKDIPKLEKALAEFHAFLCACRAGAFYPDVLRYEGTFENRDGERFVHFLDEAGKERKVRTDEKIDPRRHYYCFATNNPVHLWPVLIPKL